MGFFPCFWSPLIGKCSLLFWLFNRRLTLTHRRNQTRHVFYDLVNEQRCCETCVWALGGGRMGVRCLIGIHPHPSLTRPFVCVVEHSPESNADRQESVSTFPQILTYPSPEPGRASSVYKHVTAGVLMKLFVYPPFTRSHLLHLSVTFLKKKIIMKKKSFMFYRFLSTMSGRTLSVGKSSLRTTQLLVSRSVRSRRQIR